MNKKLIFIFSLPRSGSTLLQTILANHEAIDAIQEPHILLPLVYATRSTGIYAEYDHYHAAIGIEDFFNSLPKGKDDYMEELRKFALSLYNKISRENTIYFVDRTVRYHLIAQDIINLFPDGKFIFLWRNPIAVMASLVTTFANGKWSLYRNKADFLKGLPNLISVFKANKDKAIQVRYEDILDNPDIELQKLCDYLKIDFKHNMIEKLGDKKIKGRLGDPKFGTYHAISKEPLEKWKNVITNPLRKAWCRRYLKWLGKERLAVMGYDLEMLLSELDGIPSKPNRILSDLLWMGLGFLLVFFESEQLKDKIRLLPQWYKIYRHT